jgi:hypothetical protein
MYTPDDDKPQEAQKTFHFVLFQYCAIHRLTISSYYFVLCDTPLHSFCSLILNDLRIDDKYLVSLNVSVCLESTGSCMLTMAILKDIKFEKASCGLSSSGVYI